MEQDKQNHVPENQLTESEAKQQLEIRLKEYKAKDILASEAVEKTFEQVEGLRIDEPSMEAIRALGQALANQAEIINDRYWLEALTAANIAPGRILKILNKKGEINRQIRGL